MKSTIVMLFSLALGLNNAFPLAKESRQGEYFRAGSGDSMEFSDKAGRRIKISRFGNLLSWRSPAGFEHVNNDLYQPREGYTLVYQDPSATGSVRVMRNVGDDPTPDLRPISFSSTRPPGSVINLEETLKVTAVTETADGLFRLTHEFTWKGGTGQLEVKRTVRCNYGLARLIEFRSHSRINSASNFFGTQNGVGALMLRGPCPPPPPMGSEPICSPLVARYQGKPGPTGTKIDNLQPASSAAGGDYEVTLRWQVNADLQGYPAYQSRAFTTTYSVE